MAAGYLESIPEKCSRQKSTRPLLFWSCIILIAVIMIVPALVCGLFFGLAHSRATNSIPLTVDLGYAKYTGADAKNGVSQWFGIRYAAAPVGDLRFRAPRDPAVENKVITANTVLSPFFNPDLR